MISGAHILTKNHKVETPDRIIFFDTESRVNTRISDDELKQAELNAETVEKEHKIYLACACFYNALIRNTEAWKDYTGDNLCAEFWYDVVAYTAKKSKTVVFAHNAKYDVLVSKCIPLLNQMGFMIIKFSDSNPFFLKFVHPERKATILILSSTNFYNTSLAKLAECFNMKKTGIDYELSDIESSKEYCRNDVNILKVAMLSFIRFIQLNELGNFQMTIAGQAFSAYRHRFMTENTIYIHRTKDALITERAAYAGGRNEANYIGKISTPVYYVDVNSMYPYVMKNELFPVKLITFRKQLNNDEAKNFIRRGYGLCAVAELNTDIPAYFKKQDKLLFPIGEFETALSTPEIIYGLKHGHIKNLKNVCIYEMGAIFSDYVDFFYGERLKAKAEGNEVFSYLYKIFLNSLYGKFGQKNIEYEKVDTADIDMIESERVYNADLNRWESYKIFGGGVFVSISKPEGEQEAYNSFPAIAAHVTSYARLLLFKYILIAGVDNVYYMDTDSLFINEAGYNNLNEYGAIDSKELGKLKLEKVCSDVEIYSCKDYKFGDEIKLKGISIKQLKTGSTIKIDDTHYAVTVWRGFSKAIKEKKLDGYSNELMIKELSRSYDKGIISDTGRVYPFTLAIASTQ